jgi:K+-transporting ATPase KdpF subunit
VITAVITGAVTIVAAVLAVASLVYLVFALLKPERF